MTRPLWLLSAGAGIVSAALFIATPPVPLLAILLIVLGTAALYMAGLGLGPLAGALAAAVSVVCVLVLRGPLSAAVAAAYALPVAILVRQAMLSRGKGEAMEWYPAGLLAAVLALIGMLLSVGNAGLMSWLVADEFFDEWLRSFAENFSASNDEISADEVMKQMEPAKRVLPGLMTGFQMAVLLAGGALAQAALVKLGRNLRPWPDFADMELPNWMAIVAAATIAGAMLLPEPAVTYALGMAFAVCFAYLLQGLAVVHAFNRKIQGGTILLVIFYLLTFMTIWPPILVVLLGAVEQFAGFRQRWRKGAES